MGEGKPQATEPERLLVGWREWLALPDLGIPAIKAKIDTGARSSSLHAESIHTEPRDGQDWVRFRVAPLRGHSSFYLHCAAPVADERYVRSSNGQRMLRLFVTSRLAIGGHAWEIQISLADRAEMKLPMLLGRAAMAGRMRVEPGRSYLTGRKLPHYYRDHGIPRIRKKSK